MIPLFQYLSALLVLAGFLLSSTAPAPAADVSDGSSSYRFSASFRLFSNLTGHWSETDTETDLCYTVRTQGRELVLLIDDLKTKRSQDGREQVRVTANKDRYDEVREGGSGDSPMELDSVRKKALRESFGIPLVKIVLDGNSAEVKRIPVAGLWARELLDSGQVDNARFFHPSFPSGQSRWRDVRVLRLGVGLTAGGTLEYEVKNTRMGKATVLVSGHLDGERPGPLPAGVEVATRYDVSGKQVFDTARREWEKGELLLKVTGSVKRKGNPVGKTEGTLKLKTEPRTAR